MAGMCCGATIIAVVLLEPWPLFELRTTAIMAALWLIVFYGTTYICSRSSRRMTSTAKFRIDRLTMGDSPPLVHLHVEGEIDPREQWDDFVRIVDSEQETPSGTNPQSRE